MTALDTVIKAALDSLNIKQYPCLILPDGKIKVGDISSALNCVVETYIKIENQENGQRRVTSGFYMFSSIKKDLDVVGDVNPKMELLANAVDKFFRAMSITNFKTAFVGDITASQYQTTGNETGFSFMLSFDYFAPTTEPCL